MKRWTNRHSGLAGPPPAPPRSDIRPGGGGNVFNLLQHSTQQTSYTNHKNEKLVLQSKGTSLVLHGQKGMHLNFRVDEPAYLVCDPVGYMLFPTIYMAVDVILLRALV